MAENAIENERPPEPEAAAAGDVPAKKFDPGFQRNMKVIFGVIFGFAALVVLLVIWRSSSTEKKVAAVNSTLTQSTINSGGEQDQLSPAMQEALRAKQLAEQKKASDNGDPIFIPKDTLAAPVSLIAPKAPISELSASTLQANQQTSGSVQGEVTAADTRRRQGLEIQLRQLLDATPDTGGSTPQRISFEDKTRQQGAAAAGNNTGAVASNGAANAVGAAAKNPPIVEGLEILAAETASPVDTYKTKYASARIVAGKLAGAFLIGTSVLAEDGLSTNYTMMRFSGKTYAIDAIALDEKTSTDAMSASIDRRYLQRYVMPVVGAAIGGAASALAQTGSSVVASVGGALGTSTPAPTKQQGAYAGLAAGVGIAQRVIEGEAQKPLQATLPANTPIGILFRAPVEQSLAK